MNTENLYDLGDMIVLVVLYVILGGDLAVLGYLCYAAIGFALDFIRKDVPVSQ